MRVIILLSIFLGISFSQESLIIGAGGGYKKPILEIIENLKKDGINIQGSFANLQQISMQAKEGKMAIIVGDEAFLNKTGLDIMAYQKIGVGNLVLVTAKEKKIDNIKDIQNFNRIAIPDEKKAIYGVRAMEFLQNSNLKSQIKNKLIPVAGVPQVVAYVLSKEVDAGFINQTEAMAKKDEFGSIIYIDKNLYSPVFISAARLKNCDKYADCDKFLDELKSERSKEIFNKFGLK